MCGPFNPRLSLFLIVALLSLTFHTSAQERPPTPDAYNVSWDTPGPTSAQSMPLGNGDIGLNVWVEPGGDLCFYISKTDAWGAQTEAQWDSWMKTGGVLMKLGEVRVSLRPAGASGAPVSSARGGAAGSAAPASFAPGPAFRQLLRLRQGEILVREGADGDTTTIRVWVDANRPVIRVEARGARPFSVRASVYDWRLGKGDTLLANPGAQSLGWYHRNPPSGEPALSGLTFGALMKGKGMVRADSVTLAGGPSRYQLLSVYPWTAKTPVAAAWVSGLNRQVARVDAVDLERARAAHQAWWNAFWRRSWIYVSGGKDAEAVTRGYVLQRFVTACAGRGAYPIKFNGSLFTVDNGSEDADFRSWGGQYWFQNTRPMYWPRLMAGDFDEMRPLFGLYLHMLPGNKAQVQQYYGHDGAYFQETSPFWGGLPYMGPEVEALYTHHYFTPILELSMMMLDYYAYTGNTAFAQDTLLPIAREGLLFYDRHFSRDTAGKLLLDPDNSIEMFWKVHNPAPDIAGLHAVLRRMLDLPPTVADAAQKTAWRKLYAALPELPVGIKNGQSVLLPYTGPQTAKAHNLENPELYAIYPFRLFGLGKDSLELARRTFDARAFREKGCWEQDPIQAAMLGLTDVARDYVTFNLTRKDPDLKFPAFWATGHDYRPDEDNGGNGENGLQQMLLQVDGQVIRLLPAWPADWNADFRLHAPGGTTVEGRVEDGKLKHLVVTPASRRTDVVVKNAYF